MDVHLRRITYDSDGYKRRAACVCVKNESENEVLLVSSSRHKNFWIVPGGGVEEHESTQEAAKREVLEEAGVMGRVDRLLGIYENTERKHRTSVFIMFVEKELDNWEDMDIRVRRWFTASDALSELDKHKAYQSTYLGSLKSFANNGTKAINGSSDASNNSHLHHPSSGSSLSSLSSTLLSSPLHHIASDSSSSSCCSQVQQQKH